MKFTDGPKHKGKGGKHTYYKCTHKDLNTQIKNTDTIQKQLTKAEIHADLSENYNNVHAYRKETRRANVAQDGDQIVRTQCRRISRKPDRLVM